LRLAVVSPFVDRRHGTERSLAELLERLAGTHHCEVHLYSQQVEDLAICPSPSPSAQERPGIVWHRVPSIPGPHLLQFLFWLFLNSLCREWHRTIRGLHFDLVLSPGINCLGADVVVVHVLFHRLRELAREWQSESAKSGFFRRSHRRVYYSFVTFLERRIYARPNVSIAAVSWRTAALLKGLVGREDVRVIPYGVDAEQFSPARRLTLRKDARARYNFLESDFVMLLIGNDWRNKGLSTVLTAMAACPEIPLRLLVAGQDAAASFFFNAAKDLGLSEQCRWETASADAIHLYAVADAYVSPTREDAFALPTLESMACGLPIITTSQNGGSQIITENVDGFVLSDPNDTGALARHLHELQEPALRSRVGANAAKTAQNYTWDRHAAAVYELLNDAISRS
jgi:UDP-glucose:(heptosyl)LPS alpha-1,3-glucosyltransferase